MVTVIDVWAQLPTSRFMREPWLDTLLRWTRQGRDVVSGETTIEAMDAAGVSVSLLSAWWSPSGALITNDDVAASVARYPERFAGVASVDLNRPVQAVHELRRAVQELGFVAVRVVPWLWDRAPDHRSYYPVYSACVDLGVPFCTQVGHTGPLCPSEPGRPIPYLERVLLDFPELTVVGGHVGAPWTDEVILLADKFPNFFVDTSAYAPRRLPARFVEYMRGRGRSRVMFGTNWPMLSPGRCLSQLDALDLDSEARSLYLWENAARVFRVDPGLAGDERPGFDGGDRIEAEPA